MLYSCTHTSTVGVKGGFSGSHGNNLCLDKFSALMTSSEGNSDLDAARDQIQRLLGRTRDTAPPRGSKSLIDVDIQLRDVTVVDVVNM